MKQQRNNVKAARTYTIPELKQFIWVTQFMLRARGVRTPIESKFEKVFGLGQGLTTFRAFEEARNFARSLKLKNKAEWVAYCTSGDKPDNIPSRPDKAYKNQGWLGYGDWLGNEFRPFAQAKELALSLKLKSQAEWKKYCKSGKKPADIPSSPDVTYKDNGWISWGDWLGTGNVSSRSKK
jgi:hypothetical protein